jgi:glycosyltransferase involved in cell wall biosynthesis
MPVKHFHAEFLAKALGSIHRQTCPDWRLLIIVEPDDLDRMRAYLAAALQDLRVTLVANRGRKLAGAFNTGMQDARTEFVAILLGDDMWAEDTVETLHHYMDRFPHAEFFHSSRRVVDERDEPISSVHASREDFRLEDFFTSSPVKHLLCWKRDVGLAIGGMDESLNSVGPDDFDFPWSMAEHGVVFQAIHECLYIYRDHREGYRLTTHLPMSVHASEMARIMKKHGATPHQIRARVSAARHSYLRQCLYRSEVDRWLKERLGQDPRAGWRERYS